jgi:glycosyltransferase involved in cell wall biosynthesis
MPSKITSPLISVIIPVGPNHEQYLETAIESVRQQTLPSEYIEAIVIRDIDGQGAGWARNQGLELAQGKLICWLDSDDYLTPGSLEAMLKWYAYCDEAYVYGDWWDAWDDTRTEYRVSDNYTQHAHLKGGLHVITTLMATDDIKSFGGFTNLKGWEDWNYWCKAALHGLCGSRVPYPVLVYRITHGFRRNQSYAMQDELKTAHIELYGDYITGKKTIMPCCGGNKAAKDAARLAIQQLGLEITPMATDEQYVRMEYLGQHKGPKSYTPPSGNVYQGAKNGTNQFINAAVVDVEWLTRTQLWRAVPRMPAGHENPPPPPIPHLIKDDGLISQSESPNFTVPIDGEASPAPVVQFAPPPISEEPNSRNLTETDAALDPTIEMTVADNEGVTANRTPELPPADPNDFDPALLNRPGRKKVNVVR